ncbi:TPA: hypothetical protein R4045_001085 [Citrobacter freundii]|nr:hypothetical protein [Citrobacter freundii]
MNLAAIWEMILNCEWARIWWGITHAHWANVWASISAIFTTLAVAVAGWALIRWKKQDELKAKMVFKTAVYEYLIGVLSLPSDHNGLRSTGEVAKNLKETMEKFTACRHAWLMLEGLLENDKLIKASWDYLSENNGKFLSGEIGETLIIQSCSNIIGKKFVFK